MAGKYDNMTDEKKLLVQYLLKKQVNRYRVIYSLK